jgi:L,D-transpeptidase ErfK/SrfK|tara:strand:+ start:194 stop:1069 length:876 start_codon:yes stop_codon:yes gene_type:complete
MSFFTITNLLAANVYDFDNSIQSFGHNQSLKAVYEDTLVDLARQYNLGFNEIIRANPNVDKWLPGEGTIIKIPTQHIIPKGFSKKGITINLSEFRGYLIKDNQLITFPVGLGRMDWKTPLGISTIDLKLEKPAWYPPQSVRDEYKNQGKFLPAEVLPGPDNPLGELAMRISIPGGYFIHGTNRPDGVGMEISHGCIRLFPEDIDYIFQLTDIGTEVILLDQPVKIARIQNDIYLQVHPSYSNQHDYNLEKLRIEIELLVNNQDELIQINWDSVESLLKAQNGLATKVTVSK